MIIQSRLFVSSSRVMSFHLSKLVYSSLVLSGFIYAAFSKIVDLLDPYTMVIFPSI